jgi:hypothetical protein
MISQTRSEIFTNTIDPPALPSVSGSITATRRRSQDVAEVPEPV